MYLQLYQIKKHLNINEEWHDDDEYLVDLALVAESVVSQHIDKKLSDLEDERGLIPAPLVHAMLLFIGDMYQSRESVAFTNATEIPFSYDYLLSLYKDYSKKETNGGIF